MPAPARRAENMFSMRYLGDESAPAPRLHDVVLEDPERFMQSVSEGVLCLAQAGVVHADLSAFNILVFQGEPWFIDLSEGIRIDRTGSSRWMRVEEATAALKRGITALNRYFSKYGMKIDEDDLIERVLALVRPR